MNDNDLLNSTYQGAKMGCEGINHLIQLTDDTSFRNALENEFEEYQQIISSANEIMQEQNNKPKDLGLMAKASSYISTSLDTLMDKSTSHMAEMMIEGNTMGITEITKDIKEYQGQDKRVMNLANKLLKTEQANIEEMKNFL